MQNYGDVLIRPVKETSSTIEVIIRPLFKNLIELVSLSSSLICLVFVRLVIFVLLVFAVFFLL